MGAPDSDLASRPAVRRARTDDAAAAVPLLLGSAEAVYTRYAGGTERALAVLHTAFTRDGNIASAEITSVAEVGGEVVAVLAGFPLGEEASRSRAFLGVTLRSLPPWRWPGAMRLFMTGARAGGEPASAFYVDSLATDRGHRRQGAARALLEDAAQRARERGLDALALDTFVDNHAARALYLDAGFQETVVRPPARGLPGSVVLVRPLR
jgi:ribosomal protein S18 acetylase RimI-like enzyme